MITMEQRFMRLARIDSESGNEDSVLVHLQAMLRDELGAECKRDEFGNLVARVPGKGSLRTVPILLCAHADTVKPGIGIEPFLEDGIFRSGSNTILGADNKAGIVEIVEAVLTAERRPPVEIVITRSEEIGLLGAKNLDLSLIDSKIGFVLDTADLNSVLIGGPTHINIDIQIFGKGAHAGIRPEEGISAIRTAAKAILMMPEGRIDPETTANIGIIHGGEVRNGIPAKVCIQAECRSLNHEKALHQATVIENAFLQAAHEMGARVEVSPSIEYEATRIALDRPVVQAACRAITSAGFEPKPRVSTGGSDAIVLTAMGIETVVLGYGGKQAHSTEEHIALKDMDSAVLIVKNLLDDLA